ncbi:MAG TPA: tetratricopeptide repeat protein [Pyrinomonadaceae bacterium]|jgi:Flp pilus assembly protein TadD/endonuclease YncB( thermonuclease family)|nr:tetratricopeptide repeat protein [Pyrinomonadaceae bacterium]
MKTSPTRALIFPSLLLLACLASTARASNVEGTVLDAADGATLVVSTRDNTAARFRLRSLKVPPATSAFGSLARKHLSDLTKGKRVRLRVTAIDRDGTMVGPVFDGTADVAMQMLRDGAARLDEADLGWQEEYARSLYVECEAAARAEGRGVWEKGVVEELARAERAAPAPAAQPGKAAPASDSLDWTAAAALPSARPAAPKRKGAPKTPEEKADGLGNMAVALLKQGRPDAAMPYARELVQLTPKDPKAHTLLAVLLNLTGSRQEALSQCREALRLDPQSPLAHLFTGNVLVSMQRYEEGVREYREAVRLNPRLANAHFNLGVVLMLLNRDREALASYREVDKLAPGQAVVKNNVGLVLYKLGKEAEARALWREVLKSGDAQASKLAQHNLDHLP